MWVLLGRISFKGFGLSTCVPHSGSEVLWRRIHGLTCPCWVCPAKDRCAACPFWSVSLLGARDRLLGPAYGPGRMVTNARGQGWPSEDVS